MSTVALITDEGQLETVGIELLGHRLKILSAIQLARSPQMQIGGPTPRVPFNVGPRINDGGPPTFDIGVFVGEQEVAPPSAMATTAPLRATDAPGASWLSQVRARQ